MTDPNGDIIELSTETSDGNLVYDNKYASSNTENELDNLILTNPKEFTERDDSIGYNRIYIAATQPQVIPGEVTLGGKQKNKSRRFRKRSRKTRKQRK